MEITASLCIFTNDHITVETLDAIGLSPDAAHPSAGDTAPVAVS
jgi:hypothetical protein